MTDRTAGQASNTIDSMSRASRLQAHWEQDYQSSSTPFDTDEPDEWIVHLEKNGKIKGRVLDAGCGPGRTSLYLADRGNDVLGVDISTNAIERAQRRATERGSSASFMQANICTLTDFDRSFDTVIDIGCFHSLYKEDRTAYAANLFRMCRPGAVIYLRAISMSNQTSGHHPSGKPTPALSEEQIRTAFSSSGWMIEDLSERQIELFLSEKRRPKVYCWFAVIHRP